MNPVLNKLNGIFIPVSDIEKARDWYCNLFGLPADGDVLFGHMYVIPLEGPDLVLDSKIFAPENVYKVPAAQFHAEDIHKAYEFIQARNVELITGIENGHWFNFKDPNGNLLMVCR